ncbi:outer membrane lipid asymmetry maintenance protein MlaD [soil metagenome]
MAARGQQWAETGVGAIVLAAAGAFLVYALSHADLGGVGAGYELTARFGQVGGLAPGADVRVAGVKVGSVSRIDLDPKTYLAKASFAIDSKVHLPADSTVKITSDSLLGGQHISIEPGGSAADLKPGAEFENVQGAVDLFGLIGQVIRPAAAATPAAAASANTPSSATPAPAADPYPGGN